MRRACASNPRMSGRSHRKESSAMQRNAIHDRGHAKLAQRVVDVIAAPALPTLFDPDTVSGSNHQVASADQFGSAVPALRSSSAILATVDGLGFLVDLGEKSSACCASSAAVRPTCGRKLGCLLRKASRRRRTGIPIGFPCAPFVRASSPRRMSAGISKADDSSRYSGGAATSFSPSALPGCRDYRFIGRTLADDVLQQIRLGRSSTFLLARSPVDCGYVRGVDVAHDVQP